MVKIKVYTSKDRCDLGTVEIYVRYSAQYLVHGAQAVEKRLSATADVDDYNIKMENPERERTLRVSSCSSRELQRIGIPQ